MLRFQGHENATEPYITSDWLKIRSSIWIPTFVGISYDKVYHVGKSAPERYIYNITAKLTSTNVGPSDINITICYLVSVHIRSHWGLQSVTGVPYIRKKCSFVNNLGDVKYVSRYIVCI